MKTAVDFIRQEIEDIFGDSYDYLFEQAKEMEKQQIIKAHTNGWNSGSNNDFITSHEYYNKKYKKHGR